jgi:SAM-dependent methyltransferase
MASRTETSGAGEYVLGTDAVELSRLGMQNQLWSDAAHQLWARAQIRLGMRILDVGCGPGYAAFDMAQIVRDEGFVLGIDESANYVAHLNQQAGARRILNCAAVQGDVQRIPEVLAAETTRRAADGRALAGSFDLAWARWVLCFVPDPGAVVAGVGKALKPGGRFCVQDYFNYESMSIAPRTKSWERTVAATAESWRARGGDPDIVGRLPRMMRENGMRVDHIAVHQRVARPADTMWQWVEVWWKIYAPKLVQMGLLAESDANELLADLADPQKRGVEFVVPPPVFEVIGVRER